MVWFKRLVGCNGVLLNFFLNVSVFSYFIILLSMSLSLTIYILVIIYVLFFYSPLLATTHHYSLPLSFYLSKSAQITSNGWDNPKRNSPPSPQYHHPTPLRENPGEEKICQPPKEGALEALLVFLHLPLSRLSSLRLSPHASAPPLLGPNHSPLLSLPVCTRRWGWSRRPRPWWWWQRLCQWWG